MDKTLVFVYGTLMSGLTNNYHFGNKSTLIGDAKTIKKYKLTASGIPYVNSEIEQSQIVGEVWEVTENQLLGPLDGLEGNGFYYTRSLVPVLVNGDEVKAWLYFNNNSIGINNIPDGDYRNFLKKQQTKITY